MKFACYLDDPKTPSSVRAFLGAALADPPVAGGLPPLFGTLRHDFPGRGEGGATIQMKAGDRVRVTDAGRVGDVGITLRLDETKNYQARAALIELTALSSHASASS
jgi:hypothetical protein